MQIQCKTVLLLSLVIQCQCEIPTVTFNNGVKIPIVGLGTSRVDPNELQQAVKNAIDIGYRHFDTAYHYGNEKEIGQALAYKIKEGVVKRQDLFITSKLWNTFHKPEHVEAALNITLQDLGLNYIDLYLIHFPIGLTEDGKEYSDDDYVDTWLAMEHIYKKGLARSIGVSNFNRRQIERILEHSTVVPVTNQVECHPYLNQKKLLSFCTGRNITLTAHTPLSRALPISHKPDYPILLKHPKIEEIARKLQKSPAQIILRYQIQRGVIVIPKSVNIGRMTENINIFDFELSEHDMNTISSMDINGRVLLVIEKDHKYYPFDDEY